MSDFDHKLALLIYEVNIGEIIRLEQKLKELRRTQKQLRKKLEEKGDSDER